MEAGSDHPERASRPAHTSGHDSSQYTFAHVGIQAALCDTHPKGATEQLGQHGWQSALMTGMMWMSNVVGEYLRYILVSSSTLKVLGDFALDDKADVVLMAPVESLLDMIPSWMSMPYAGLRVRRLPGKGIEVQETGKTQGSSATASTL